MTIERSNSVAVQPYIFVDGYPHEPEFDPISYSGIVNAGMDIPLDADGGTATLDLTHFGTIKRLVMKPRSGTIVYEIDSSSEEYPVNYFGILTQQPTSLVLTNNHATSAGLVEVQIFGSTS